MGKVEKVEKKSNMKEFFSSIMFLKIIFVILIIVVIVLGLFIYKKEKNDDNKQYAHISVPVNQLGSDFEFGIDTLLLSKENNKEYILKITNYKDDKVNKEEIPYQVIIENPTDCIISVTKDNEDKNLMVEQLSTTIEGKLTSALKEDIYYHIVIDSVGNLQSNDLLSVKIVS